MMTMQFLAETADPMISGNWIAGIIGTLASAAALIIGKLQGRKEGIKEATNNVTIQSPVPIVPVERKYSPPTFSQHMDLARRVKDVEEGVVEMRREHVKEFTALRHEQSNNFVKLMEVGESRKDAIFEKIDGIARGFHERVDQLVRENRTPKTGK